MIFALSPSEVVGVFPSFRPDSILIGLEAGRFQLVPQLLLLQDKGGHAHAADLRVQQVHGHLAGGRFRLAAPWAEVDNLDNVAVAVHLVL